MSNLEIKDVAFRFDSGFALREINLKLPTGSFLALIGPNGSGKTTLLRIMSGLLRPESGEVYLDGKSLGGFRARELAQRLAVISSEQYFEFPFPVSEIVAMGRFPHVGKLQRLSSLDRRIVDEALHVTHTNELKERSISELSSGERQRVLIARAVAQQPSILMLDEPNAHLDVNHQIAIFRLLQHLNKNHSMLIITVLHDLTAAAAFCRSVALLSEGQLVKVGSPKEVITTEIIRKVYRADIEIHPSPLGGFPQITYAG